MFCDSSYGPIFGKNDLYICNNSNKDKHSSSELGYTYEKSENTTDLIGENKLIEEIEVFTVKLMY